jgi:hypothetical protein
VTKLKRELWVKRAKNGWVLKVDFETVVVYTELGKLLDDLGEILREPEPTTPRIEPYILEEREAPEPA